MILGQRETRIGQRHARAITIEPGRGDEAGRRHPRRLLDDVARGPVITWASRSRWRRASSLAVAAAARTLLQGQRIVRIAVHPGDTAEPTILASIDATVAALMRGRSAGRYADLVPTPAPATAMPAAPVTAMPRSQ